MHDLQYDIVRGRLEGRLDGIGVSVAAGSGGRAGSRTPGAENWHLSGNPFATHIGGAKSAGTHIYGPLPLGEYALSLRADRKNWIVLTPKSGNMFGRSAFAIHGRGSIGSHGCIVVFDSAELARLHRLVARRAEARRAPFTLKVVATGQDLDRQLRTA